MMRDLSRSRFMSYLRIPELVITREKSDAFAVQNHSLAMVLIASSGLRVMFKTHFNAHAMSFSASQVFKKPPEQLNDSQVADFVKEFCNLVAGAIKQELELHTLQTGISLPLVTRGFDELFFTPADGVRVFTDLWALNAHKARVNCATHIEILDPRVFERMKVGQILSSDDQSGTVENL